MTRRGFSLVELLVVVGIIALLVALLAPALSRAGGLARSALCATHLRQLGAAFHGAEAQPQADRKRYSPAAWPSVPMNVCPKGELYLCPEARGQAIPALTALRYVAPGALGVKEIAFSAASPYHPPDPRATAILLVRNQTERWAEYRYEDWPLTPATDYDDATIRIYDGPPRYGEVRPEHSTPYKVSLYLYDRLVIDDCRYHDYEKFPLPDGSTDYAINAKVGRYAVTAETVVLLDYQDEFIADPDQDIAVKLAKAARHLGRLNLLLADESVRPMGPTALDPALPSNRDLWEPDR